MARGGARVPERPAAVSGPGANSARTDGGPADRKMGTASLAAGGGSYGDRKAIEEQAAAAPVATGGSEGGGSPNGAAGGGAPQGAFGPTNRPSEPITAGMAQPPGEGPDADMMLRALYQQFPTPHLSRLLNAR